MCFYAHKQNIKITLLHVQIQTQPHAHAHTLTHTRMRTKMITKLNANEQPPTHLQVDACVYRILHSKIPLHMHIRIAAMYTRAALLPSRQFRQIQQIK